MRVIAFAGTKGSGKNTAADMVGHLLHGVARGAAFDYYQIAFADRIRAAALALGLPTAMLFEDKDQPAALLDGATGRDLLVALGEAVRKVTPNFWADALVRQLNEYEGGGGEYRVVAVTDLRRGNELDALEAWERARPGRHLARVWIERPGHAADEVLEPGLRERCAVIRNAGTPADLWIRCAALAAWARGEAVTASPVDHAPRPRTGQQDPRDRHTLDVARCDRCADEKGRLPEQGCTMAPERMHGAEFA